MFKNNLEVVLCLVLASSLMFAGCKQHTVGKDPICVAPTNWFTSPLQPPDFSAFPADPTNCDFHLWAWHEFLYLTTADGKGQRTFESLALPSNLFVASGEPLDYPGTADGDAKRVLQPRHLKVDQTETAVTQAGGGVLFDQKGQVIYYEARVDQVYFDYIKDNKYYDPNNIVNAPKGAQFPVGTLEIKISWRIAKTAAETFIADAEKRFITNDVLIAPVTGYNENTKKFIVDTENPIPATVALVGMHVVGLVQGHPELVWSTFEHVDNAPALTNTPTSDPGPTGPWSFYSLGIDCKTGDCNQHPTEVPLTPPYKPTEVCLVEAQGGGDTTNVTNIISINKSVLDQLQDPVLKNYQLGGGLWTNNGELPPSPANQKGSLKLANSTLETFFQGPPPTTATLRNCFSCHNEQPPPGTTKYPNWPANIEINFSHLMALSVDYKE